MTIELTVAEGTGPGSGAEPGRSAAGRGRWGLVLPLAVAVVVASPVVLAGVSLAAEPWYPVGDLA